MNSTPNEAKVFHFIFAGNCLAFFFIGEQIPKKIAEEDWKSLLNATKRALMEKTELILSIENTWKESGIVFISVCDGIGPAIIKIGKGDNLISAINQAVKEIS